MGDPCSHIISPNLRHPLSVSISLPRDKHLWAHIQFARWGLGLHAFGCVRGDIMDAATLSVWAAASFVLLRPNPAHSSGSSSSLSSSSPHRFAGCFPSSCGPRLTSVYCYSQCSGYQFPFVALAGPHPNLTVHAGPKNLGRSQARHLTGL